MIDAKPYGPWAIIAGASEGIGVSFAHQLGRAGINLILVARQKNLLEEVAREVWGESPVQVRVLPLDLTRTDVLDRVREVADEVEIGLVVLNAAAEPDDVAREYLDNIANGPVLVPAHLAEAFRMFCSMPRRQAAETMTNLLLGFQK